MSEEEGRYEEENTAAEPEEGVEDQQPEEAEADVEAEGEPEDAEQDTEEQAEENENGGEDPEGPGSPEEASAEQEDNEEEETEEQADEGTEEQGDEDEEVTKVPKKRSILSDDSDSGPDDTSIRKKKKKRKENHHHHKSHHHKSKSKKSRHEKESESAGEEGENADEGSQQADEEAPAEGEDETERTAGSSGDDEVERETSRPKKKSDFDEMLERQKQMRGKRRKKGESEELNDMDDVIKGLIEQMRRVAEEDRKANEKSIPAVQKLKYLPSVMNMLQKMDYHAAMIDLGILGAIAEWLAPLPDRSLPNIRIREQLTDALSDFGKISKDDLRSSGIGKAVMFLYKHPKETKESKRKLEKLIHTWSRPIFDLDADMKQLTREERLQRDMEHVKLLNRRSSNEGTQSQNVDDMLQAAEKASMAKKSKSGMGAVDDETQSTARPGEPGFCPRARVPIPSQKDYVNRPKSSFETSEGDGSRKVKRTETRLDKHTKRFLEIKRSARTSRAVSLSVSEGKS